jgi:hypothetical protein
MHYKISSPSHLPSILLPCSHCGSRTTITAVAPARLASGAASNDLRGRNPYVRAMRHSADQHETILRRRQLHRAADPK